MRQVLLMMSTEKVQDNDDDDDNNNNDKANDKCPSEFLRLSPGPPMLALS
jgi:hypothetical protein